MKDFFTRILKASLSVGLVAAVACTDDTNKIERPNFGNERSSAALTTFESCNELEAQLKTSILNDTEANLWMQYEDYLRYGYGWGMDDVAEGAGAPESADASSDGAGSSGGREEGVDFSGTNNQEEGVDEADFVKTDGYFIYTLHGGQLRIFEVPEFGDLVHMSRTNIEGYPTSMLLDGDRLVVFSNVYTWNLPEGDPLRELVGDEFNEWGWYWRAQELTKVTVLDLSNRLEPQAVKELYLEGWYKTAREVEGRVRMVSYSWMNIPGLKTWLDTPEAFWNTNNEDERERILYATLQATLAENEEAMVNLGLDDFIPKLYERNGPEFSQYTFSENECANFAMSDDGTSRGITSILSLDLVSDALSYEADHLVTGWSNVYASTDTLIIAEPAQDWWWYWNNQDFDEATNIHRFDISNGVTTVYTGSGRVDGLINNQFSLSEHNDYIRVASTTGQWGRWWMEEPTPPANHVFVLAGDEALNVVGSVRDIAVNERIWSSRFVGDMAYLVTFRNIDPLWTIDLSTPEEPVILGELEVPGVSTYIHPLTEDGHLLTIGFGGDDDGLDWNTQVSLFDVQDPTTPTLADAYPFAQEPGDGWYYAWSEANYEHKAFQYWGPRNMLAVPVSTYRYDYETNRYDYRSRLMLMEINTEQGDISPYGSVDHSEFYNSRDYWWDYRDIRRSIFMGDYIYAIGSAGITAHNLDTLRLSASYTLDPPNYNDYYGPGGGGVIDAEEGR